MDNTPLVLPFISAYLLIVKSFFLAFSKMLDGIGYFLLGMNFMEESIHKLAGRSFKLFLRHQSTISLKLLPQVLLLPEYCKVARSST